MKRHTFWVAALLLAFVLPVTVAAAAKLKPKPVPSSVDTHDYPRTFHLYGGGPPALLARYDLVVGFRGFNIGLMRLMNPDGVFLMQPTIGGDSVHVSAPGGAINFRGATDDSQSGKPLGSVPAVTEADLLHNSDGSLAGIGRVLGWNLAKPGVPQTVATVIAYAAKQDGLFSMCRARGRRVPCWNGIHSDNWIYGAIGASWFYGPNLDTNGDGKPDDPPTLRRGWSNGLTEVGDLLRTDLPGKDVGGNGIWYEPNLYAGADPNGWLKASNYTLIEDMENYSIQTIRSTTRRWLSFRDPRGQPRYIALLQKATNASGTPLVWTQGDPNSAASIDRPDVLRSMRWGLTLALMTGAYYELYGNFYGDAHDARWWFDEYDGGQGVRKRGYLGQPVGAANTLADGVMRRDFDHGIVLNNSTSNTQRVRLGDTFKKLKGVQDPQLNNGQTVTSVTIPPHDGIILLRLP